MAKTNKDQGQKDLADLSSPETGENRPIAPGGNPDDFHRELMMMFERTAATDGEETRRQSSMHDPKQTEGEERNSGNTDLHKQLTDRARKIESERSSRWEKIYRQAAALGGETTQADSPPKIQDRIVDHVHDNNKKIENRVDDPGVVISVQDESQDNPTVTAPDFLSSPLGERIREIEIRNRSRQTADIERLKSVINDFAETIPQSTLEEKKKLGRWITAELAQFGLAVECPDTPGLPVEVKGEVAKSAGSSRFQFSPLKTGDGPKRRGVFRDVLPRLNFVQLTNSVDLSASPKPETSWRER